MQRFQSLPLAPLLVTFIAGILLGWLVLGWWIAPVSLTDAGPRNLDEPHLDNYVAALVPFANSGDTVSLGEALCYPVDDFNVVNERAVALKKLPQAEQAPYGIQIQQYTLVLNALSGENGCEQIRTLRPPERVSLFTGERFPLVQCLSVLLILALLGALLWFLLGNRLGFPMEKSRRSVDVVDDEPAVERTSTRRRPVGDMRRSRRLPEERVQPEPEQTAAFVPPPAEPETTQYRRAPQSESFSSAEAGFVATYTRGNESFERVFEIYGTDNQYLGDCSVQIADTIGNDRSNVTAFEIRLFEVGNPRSVTKLVMSEHAYNDSGLRAKLATQGQPVLAERGIPIMLEGNTITIETDITELIYADVIDEPTRSVFDRFSVKLKAFVNRPGGSSINDRADDLLNY